MARGPSGRLVIEVDPLLKRDLHSALAADGSSVKEWFLKRVTEYFAERDQLALPGFTRSSPPRQTAEIRSYQMPKPLHSHSQGVEK